MAGDGLNLADITVRFGATVAVDQASIQIPNGAVTAVLGPSGCGKSTLLRVVAGLQRPDSGQVSFAGSPVTHLPTHRRGFALMFQDGQLFEHLSVAQNISYGLRRRGLSNRDAAPRVAELLDLVGLSGMGERQPATLSGGQAQRVALARALAPEPRLLLLDEPLSALDRSMRDRLGSDLRAILSATATTTLLVTHDHDEAFTLADRMALMSAGRIVQDGPTAQVWAAPVDAQTARFLGYSTVLDAASAVQLGLGDQPVALRRQALRLDPGGALPATVLAAAQATDALRLRVRWGAGVESEAMAEIGTPAPPVGAQIRLRFDPAAVAVLPE